MLTLQIQRAQERENQSDERVPYQPVSNRWVKQQLSYRDYLTEVGFPQSPIGLDYRLW